MCFLTCGTHSEQLHRVGNNSGCVIRVLCNLAGHCIGSVVMLYTCTYVCVSLYIHMHVYGSWSSLTVLCTFGKSGLEVCLQHEPSTPIKQLIFITNKVCINVYI